MPKGKSNISKAATYGEIGDFWDQHDLGDYADQGKAVEFEVNLETEVTYYPVEKGIVEKMRVAARRHGVPADTLVNIWLKEKLQQELPE